MEASAAAHTRDECERSEAGVWPAKMGAAAASASRRTDLRLGRRDAASSMKWDRWNRSTVRGTSSRCGLPTWTARVRPRSSAPLVARAQHPIYGHTECTESVYGSVQNWMQSHHGWTVERDRIAFSPGVMPCLAFIVKTFTTPAPGPGLPVAPPKRLWTPKVRASAPVVRRAGSRPRSRASGTAGPA